MKFLWNVLWNIFTIYGQSDLSEALLSYYLVYMEEGPRRMISKKAQMSCSVLGM